MWKKNGRFNIYVGLALGFLGLLQLICLGIVWAHSGWAEIETWTVGFAGLDLLLGLLFIQMGQLWEKLGE